MIEELKKWIQEQANEVSDQHAKMGEDRIRLEGRYEACSAIVQKIDQMTAVQELSDQTQSLEKEALAETAEASEQTPAKD